MNDYIRRGAKSCTLLYSYCGSADKEERMTDETRRVLTTKWRLIISEMCVEGVVEQSTLSSGLRTRKQRSTAQHCSECSPYAPVRILSMYWSIRPGGSRRISWFTYCHSLYSRCTVYDVLMKPTASGIDAPDSFFWCTLYSILTWISCKRDLLTALKEDPCNTILYLSDWILIV